MNGFVKKKEKEKTPPKKQLNNMCKIYNLTEILSVSKGIK